MAIFKSSNNVVVHPKTCGHMSILKSSVIVYFGTGHANYMFRPISGESVIDCFERLTEAYGDNRNQLL